LARNKVAPLNVVAYGLAQTVGVIKSDFQEK